MVTLVRSALILICAKGSLLGVRAALLLAMALVVSTQTISQIAFAIALAEMARLAADWGTDTWAIRAIALARDPSERASTVTATAIVKVVGGLTLALVVTAVLSRYEAYTWPLLAGGAALLIFANQCVTLTIAYFQATNALPRLLIAVALPSAVICAVTLATLYLTQSGMHAFLTLAVGETLMAAILILALQREKALQLRSCTLNDVRDVAVACVPAALFSMILAFYSRMDTMILSTVSASALAAYTVAHRMFLPFQVGVTSLGAILYGSMSMSLRSKQALPHRMFIANLPAVIGVSCVAALTLWLAGSFFIEKYFHGYSESLPALRILAVLLVVLAFNAAVAGYVLAMGHFTAILLIACVDFVVAGSAMLVWAADYGAEGAARALLLGGMVNATIALAVAIALKHHSRTSHS